MLGVGCCDLPTSGLPNEANISATEMPVSSLPLTLPLDTECALKRIISALAFPAISGSSRRFGSEMISLDIPHVVSSTDSIRRSERDRTGIGTLVGMAVGSFSGQPKPGSQSLTHRKSVRTIEVALDRSASWQAELHRLLHQVVVGDEEAAVPIQTTCLGE